MQPRGTSDVHADRQLPGHRKDAPGQVPAAVRVLGSAASAVGGGLVAALYLLGAPVVAFATGVGQILVETRENAVRPRPFVGARHGLPFLDRVAPSVKTEE